MPETPNESPEDRGETMRLLQWIAAILALSLLMIATILIFQSFVIALLQPPMVGGHYYQIVTTL